MMQMPRVYIKFGQETGAVDVQTDIDQFSDPQELKAWGECLHLMLARRVLIAPGTKIDVREAAARVQMVVNKEVRDMITRKELWLQDGRWRYVSP